MSETFLRNRYAVVGIGETEYLRGSGRTTRAMAHTAIGRAMADAGLAAADIDGFLSYQMNDSVASTFVAADLGIRPNFYMDCYGGGASVEALVGLAMGAIEAGMCRTVVIFRSLSGHSQVRIGGTGTRARIPVSGDMLHTRAYGWESPAQMFSPTFIRHMHDHGTTKAQIAAVKVAHSKHASNNPKALLKKRVTVEEVLASRPICGPVLPMPSNNKASLLQ